MITPVFSLSRDYRRELRANAIKAGLTPDAWLHDAIHTSLAIFSAIRRHQGSAAVVNPDGSIYTLTPGDLEAYRRSGSISPMECVPEDLGGYPPGVVVRPGAIDDAVADALTLETGASGPHEAICYSVWFMVMLARTIRKLHPQGELGVAWDGVFRSLARPVYARAHPSAYEPAVPVGIPIEQQIVEWLKALSGCRELRRVDRRTCSTSAALPVLFGRLDGKPLPDVERVPRAAMDELPQLAVIFMGPTKARAAGLAIAHLPSDDDLIVWMDDVLVDPAPLADARDFLAAHPSSILTGCLGVVTGRPPKGGGRP